MASTGIYLALGANLGNRQANIALALRMLEPLVRVEAVSSLYESPPQGGALSLSKGPAGQPPYYNAACRVITGLRPLALLRHVQRVEDAIGRRAGERWGPRPVDIDIALYEDLVLSAAGLTIPHPMLKERAFVLRPVLDIDPDAVDPASGERLADVLARVGEGSLKLIVAGEWHGVALI